jgi:hypothetical protein
MNSEPVSGNFQVPPWPPQPGSVPLQPEYPSGELLFDEITEFYSWYVYACLDPTISQENSKSSHSIPKILSVMKRIAEVSMNGGNFLSQQDELRAIESLSNILHDLKSGKLRRQDLPDALKQITDTLTNGNPKAKVVSQTTELEYRLCINPSREQSSELTGKYQKILSRIIEKIGSGMPEINASAIAQNLLHILDNTPEITDIHEAIDEAVKHWL